MVIHHSGTDLPYHVVRRVLRQHQVKPHGPASPLRQINWMLPNRELASIWGTTTREIANLRGRLGVGPARWNSQRAGVVRDSEHQSALSNERQKALRQRLKKAAPPVAGQSTLA